MPVRGCKIKSEPQSSDQSFHQIKTIQEINPDDVFNFADQYQLFRKYYPNDPESEVADKIFAMVGVLDHFKNNIMNSPFLSKRDQLSRCRSSFTKALSQHQSSALQARVSKNQLTPSAYLSKFEDIKKLLDSTFANADIEGMIDAFNDARTEINQLVQQLSQIHQKLPNRDKEFHESYTTFQKVKKTFVTQVNQLREYHQSRRCTSLVAKNDFLMKHFITLCKILTPKQSNIKDKGISYFNEITKCFIEIKVGLLGFNITSKIDSLLKKLDTKKDSQSLSDNEEYDDDEKALSSRNKVRNRRNTRTTSNGSRQTKKNVKNSVSTKDDNNYYEYEEEEEEEDIVIEEEEEEEEEILEEEEEEEEEEEIEEVVVNQPKRNRRSNSSKSEQNKKVDNSRRSRTSTRSNPPSSSSSSSTSSNNQRSSSQSRTSNSSTASNSSATNSRNKRGSRSRSRSETSTNDNRSSKVTNDQSSSSSANKRGRSRNGNKNDTDAASNSNSSSSLSNANASSSRGRRGQAVGIAARFIETSLSNGANSSQRGRSSNVANEANLFSPRRTRRRRGSNDDNASDDDEESKSKSHTNSNSIPNSKEISATYNTRSSSRSREKESKDAQGFSSSSSGNQGKGRSRNSNNSSSEIETKAQAQERKLVCGQIDELTKPLLEAIGQDSLLTDNENESNFENENESNFSTRILSPLRELYRSEHPTESGLHSAFNKSCKEFRIFLEKMDFELFPIKFFYMVHEIEVYKIVNNVNNKNIDQLITSVSNLSEKLSKYQQFQFIELIITDLLEQLSDIIGNESSFSEDQKSSVIQNYGKDPRFLMNIFEEMFNVMTPIICLLRTILPYNLHIKTNKLARTCEYLSIPYKNYLDRQSNVYSTMHLHQYNPVPFKSMKSNQDFDLFISFLCQEIESNGIQIVNNQMSQEFNCLNIIVPKINDLLRNMQNHLFVICANITDDGLNQISSNLLSKIYEIGKVLEIEKSVCKIKNSYPNLESVVDFNSLFSIIKTFRNIHFLFIALDGRNVISYSNALNFTYARLFAEKICEYDILENQFLCAPIDPSKVIKIRDILNVSQSESMEEKLKSSYLVRMRSFDYFPLNYFVTLFNIENVKAPLLKASSSAASASPSPSPSSVSSTAVDNPLIPAEMSDLVFAARLKTKKNDENHLENEDEIALVKRVFGIDKDFDSVDHKFENISALIKSLSDIYLNMLEMIVVRDQIFIIPSSLSNFLALRSESPEFAEKLSSIENFKEFVLIFHGTFHLNILSIINTIIKEIENISIPQQEQQQEGGGEEELSIEASEKVVAFLLLMIMKRGYLSTVTVSQFVKFITSEENKLHDVFIENENLMKSVLDLCKVIMFIDIHDKIIESMPSISNISVLRNINLSLFSSSLSRSLLFLNSTTSITITNQTPFSLSDLSELNKYGKYVLSNINEVDRYTKEEMVEAIKTLYQVLPTTVDINSELSEERMKEIEIDLRDKHFLKLSCFNLKLEIDDFVRFQSDPNKRAMKMTSPIISQLLNQQTTNNKNIIIQFCIYAFDVPKNIYMNPDQIDKRSYIGNIQLKEQKRNERLKKIDELLELKEMQFVASSDSLFIPIPCSLLNSKQQEFMAIYYQKLQEEREQLVIKEKVFQEYLEKKEFLLQQIQEQTVKRKELVEKFYAARERLKQVAQKAQRQEEMNRRRQEKEKSNQPLNNNNNNNNNNINSVGLFQFENDAILASQHHKNNASVISISKDLATLEQRTRESLETNRSFKKKIEELNKKYESKQESSAPSSSSSASASTLPYQTAPPNAATTMTTTMMQNDLNEFDVGDPEFSNIDEFVKNALIEMNLASETTFKEIEKTAQKIKMLEEGTADEEATVVVKERNAEVQESIKMAPEEKEKLAELHKEIQLLIAEKEALVNSAGSAAANKGNDQS